MIWNTCLSMSLAVRAMCKSYCVGNITQLHSQMVEKRSARRNLVHEAKIVCALGDHAGLPVAWPMVRI